MSDHELRHVLDRKHIKASLFGDVLCVELRGHIGARRLHVCMQRLRGATAKSKYGALVVNVIGAHMAITLMELHALWMAHEGSALAMRPIAVVYDAKGPEVGPFLRALARRLAGSQPAAIMGVFAAGPLVDATAWAEARALNLRAELARRETRANSLASSDKPTRKRAT